MSDPVLALSDEGEASCDVEPSADRRYHLTLVKLMNRFGRL